jgi:aryl-alcohol dehydrogenase-like predicted oxidoreductase
MKYNKLGRTGLNVSEICLGTMTWGCQNTEAEAHEQMDYAIDQGVNFFDTAELYAVPPAPETQGKTEEFIGTWFKKTGHRDKIILASKVAGAGMPWIRGGDKLSRQAIETAVEGSLTRLQTDHIDLYQLHWPNRPTYRFGNHSVDWHLTDYDKEKASIIECLEALDGLVKAGKVRHIGLSNDTSWGVMTFVNEAEKRGLSRVASIQNEYSLLWRWFDKDLAETAAAEDVGLLAYSSLVAGAISGKYLDGARPAGTRWAIDSRVMHRDTPESQAAIRDYIALAQKHGLDVCQMALAWCLTRPFMTSVIIGATKMDQLKTDIAAKDVQLSQEVLDEIETLYRKHAHVY